MERELLHLSLCWIVLDFVFVNVHGDHTSFLGSIFMDLKYGIGTGSEEGQGNSPCASDPIGNATSLPNIKNLVV